MLQVSRRVEYALRAAIWLGSRPYGSVVSFKEIAARQGVPQEFLAKILKSLVDQGLLRSVRGAQGGYALARPTTEISFLDIMEAAEGPVAINACCKNGTGCLQAFDCTMTTVWQRGEAAMLNVFRQTKLSELVRQECPVGQLSTETTDSAVGPPP